MTAPVIITRDWLRANAERRLHSHIRCKGYSDFRWTVVERATGKELFDITERHTRQGRDGSPSFVVNGTRHNTLTAALTALNANRAEMHQLAQEPADHA